MSKTRTTSDGAPLAGDLIAVLDETSPSMGAGVYYVVTTAVIMGPAAVAVALKDLFVDTPGRTRPFHWMREGPAARSRMISLMIDNGIIAMSRYQSVGRRRQTEARHVLLRAIADDLQHEQVDHLIIESGDNTTNRRDRDTLLDHYHQRGGVPFAYDWRTKNEGLLWIADACSGIIYDHFTNSDDTLLNQLIDAGLFQAPPTYTLEK